MHQLTTTEQGTTMHNNRESGIESDIAYKEYSARFKDKEYASAYHHSFHADSVHQAIRTKRFLGLFIAQVEAAAVRRLLSGFEGNLIVDAPCGSGKIIPMLYKENLLAVGIDSSREMLKRCPRIPNLGLIQGDIRCLPIQDESAKIVLCNRFLHRIPPMYHKETLREISRVSSEYAVLYFAIRTPITGFILRI